MSAAKGAAPRGARAVYANTAGCETCQHCMPTMLFTLCNAKPSEYIIDGKIQFHTIQHMRDMFVGECGDEMRLRKVSEVRE